MKVIDTWEAIFTGDPNDDYALTMEISYAGEIMAIVRRRAGSLDVDVYPISKPVSIPLEWLIDRLQTAREDLSKDATQSENQQ